MKRSTSLCKLQAVLLVGIATALASPAQTFTSLASLQGSDGGEPLSLVQGPDGNLWGTTDWGGQSNCGTLFKMTLTGALSAVFNFTCKHGDEPDGITLGTDGSFYGTTLAGGPSDAGTVFKLTPRGSVNVLLNFNGTDGTYPLANFTEGSDGKFYGVTHLGGSGNVGTIFRITPGGLLTTLYDFDSTHGSQPFAAPIQGTDGNFYGLTYQGGVNGVGTIYKIKSDGKIKVLYDFGSSAFDGYYPQGGLLQGSDGRFYGTTSRGGPDNEGTVFKITPSGVFTVLYAFSGADGEFPLGTLIQGTDGKFYGTTSDGGANGYGTIFQMTDIGALTTLHSFDGADGQTPFNLIQDTNGTFYGFTYLPNQGTVYSLSVGLGPFVAFVRKSGGVGETVGILGQGFSGTTGVSFNGMPAKFVVTSDTFLSARVPAGAKSGFVKVITPSGTLSSNISFQVVP